MEFDHFRIDKCNELSPIMHRDKLSPCFILKNGMRMKMQIWNNSICDYAVGEFSGRRRNEFIELRRRRLNNDYRGGA